MGKSNIKLLQIEMPMIGVVHGHIKLDVLDQITTIGRMAE